MTVHSALKKCLLSVILFFAFSGTILSQEEEFPPHKPSVIVGVSGLKFTGDVGKETSVSPLMDTRLGYYLAVEQRFGHVFGISLGGVFGTLAGTDNSTKSHLNFKSQIINDQNLR